MRRKFIAGNWKMNLDQEGAWELALAVAEGAAKYRNTTDVAVFPPSVYLSFLGEALAGSGVALGAQNVYHQPNGAFTGEISTSMLVDLGCRYVILGHSERRHLMNETDQAINLKVKAALAAGLLPIVCVGERLDERDAGRTADVIATQFAGSLAGLSAGEIAQVTIAYEPVWAIGTGRTASPEQAEAVHLDLRKLLVGRYNAALAESVRIQYGGSVNAKNAAELLAQPNIDGALVGGASLKADDFLAIVAAGTR